jgi:hypothetical protein
MNLSHVVEGSRFYLPRPYAGPNALTFHLLSGQSLTVEASQVSCFELLRLPNCLRDFVVMYAGFNSFVLNETKAEVLIEMDGCNART